MAAESPSPTRFCPLCETRLDAAVCPVDQVPTVRADFDAAALDDPSLGSVIAGRFKVERLLGQGATGRVYAGVQLSVERPVALKLLQPHHARDRHHVRRFYREARAATRLESPHIVRVYDFGVDDETRTPFIAMELLGGETLRDRLRRDGPLTPQDAARVGVQIARALVAFAGAGIVHRDLKPANIMLVPGPDGAEVVKVTDFGVAKDLGDHETEPLTQRGAAIGTPAYMAPEQVTGGQVSARTDLYALGCVLYELVTGHPPFASDGRAGLLVDHLLTPVAPLPSPLPTGAPAPPDLTALLSSLLAKAPEDRPESAAVVAAALVVIAERAPGSAAPRDEARRTGRQRLWLGVGGVLAVLGLATAIGVVATSDGSDRPAAVAPDSAALDEAELVPATASAMAPLPEGPVAIDQVVVRGSGGTVLLHQGAARPILVNGDRARVAGVVEDRQLSLLFVPASDRRETLEVHLWSPAWATVKVAGATTVSGAEPLDVGDLSVGLSGSARVELTVRGNAITTSLRGSSEATLSGAVERHDARASGASRLAAAGLRTRATALTAVGTSEAAVFATETLDLRNDGAGEVAYGGAPKEITRAGQGTIRASE